MYDGKTKLLVANSIDLYLINSTMLPIHKWAPEGSLTLYIQKDEPSDPDRKKNWLPEPDGPIGLIMRLYWPKDEALNDTWQPPAIKKVRQE